MSNAALVREGNLDQDRAGRRGRRQRRRELRGRPGRLRRVDRAAALRLRRDGQQDGRELPLEARCDPGRYGAKPPPHPGHRTRAPVSPRRRRLLRRRVAPQPVGRRLPAQGDRAGDDDPRARADFRIERGRAGSGRDPLPADLAHERRDGGDEEPAIPAARHRVGAAPRPLRHVGHDAAHLPGEIRQRDEGRAGAERHLRLAALGRRRFAVRQSRPRIARRERPAGRRRRHRRRLGARGRRQRRRPVRRRSGRRRRSARPRRLLDARAAAAGAEAGEAAERSPRPSTPSPTGSLRAATPSAAGSSPAAAGAARKGCSRTSASPPMRRTTRSSSTRIRRTTARSSERSTASTGRSCRSRSTRRLPRSA